MGKGKSEFRYLLTIGAQQGTKRHDEALGNTGVEVIIDHLCRDRGEASQQQQGKAITDTRGYRQGLLRLWRQALNLVHHQIHHVIRHLMLLDGRFIPSPTPSEMVECNEPISVQFREKRFDKKRIAAGAKHDQRCQRHHLLSGMLERIGEEIGNVMAGKRIDLNVDGLGSGPLDL